MRPFWPSVLLLCGCATEDPLVSPGRLGFASDRAEELVVVVDGVAVANPMPCGQATCVNRNVVGEQARGRVAMLEERYTAMGAPWFVDRSRQTLSVRETTRREDGREDVHYTLTLTSFARTTEHPTVPWGYPTTSGVRFDDTAKESLARTLDVGDGEVIVSLLFGQMGTGSLDEDDLGYVSQRAAVAGLLAHGFVAATANPSLMRRGRFQVRLVGPEVMELRSTSASAAVGTAIATSDVVYVNGHARSGLFGDVHPGARARIVFADTCWSYFLDAKALTERLPRTTLVVTDGLVITGSAEGVSPFLNLLDRGATLGELVTTLNNAADARSATRQEESEKFRVPEVYGVISPAAD